MSENRYIYYPGCSLKGTARQYEESFISLFEFLQVPFEEIDDWNCCGATAYMSIDETTAFALAARNLALAEKQDGENPEIIAPCSACYLVLNKAKEYMNEYPALKEKVQGGLRKIGLEYRGRVDIRHPLDILVNDIGIDTLIPLQKKSLEGIRIVPYYGCLLVRPYAKFDKEDNPMTMDRLLEGLGADVPPYSLKTKCCGGSLMGTLKKVGTELNRILLTEAKKIGADIIVTVCPLCQFNLEVAQLDDSDDEKTIPILYLTQIIGIALGIPWEKLGLSRQFISPELALRRLREKEATIGK
jgi:heterodisulfide reductase subunit B